MILSGFLLKTLKNEFIQQPKKQKYKLTVFKNKEQLSIIRWEEGWKGEKIG